MPGFNLGNFLSRNALPAAGGAAAGAGLMGLTNYLSDDPEEVKKKRLGSNLLMGAALGGTAGVGGNEAYRLLSGGGNVPPPMSGMASVPWSVARTGGELLGSPYGAIGLGAGLAAKDYYSFNKKDGLGTKIDAVPAMYDSMQKAIPKLENGKWQPAPMGTDIGTFANSMSAKSMLNKGRMPAQAIGQIKSQSHISPSQMTSFLQNPNLQDYLTSTGVKPGDMDAAIHKWVSAKTSEGLGNAGARGIEPGVTGLGTRALNFVSARSNDYRTNLGLQPNGAGLAWKPSTMWQDAKDVMTGRAGSAVNPTLNQIVKSPGHLPAGSTVPGRYLGRGALLPVSLATGIWGANRMLGPSGDVMFGGPEYRKWWAEQMANRPQ